MDYGSFLKAADRGDVAPVTLLQGSAPFLLDDAVRRLTRAICRDPSGVALSREILEAREAGVEGILRSALTLSWDGGRRLVVVRGAEAWGSKQGEPLAAYLRAPNPSTALLLLVGQGLEAGHWLLAALPRDAVVRVPEPSGGALATWLREWASAEGLELDKDAATLLVDLCGDDLATLVGEVQKAALAGGADNRRVTVEEVRAVVGEHRLHHVFELTRALARRDRGAALVLLDSLLNEGEEPLAVLGMLVREARAAWQVSEWLRLGRSPDEIGRRLRRPPPAAAALIEYAAGVGAVSAERRLARCWEVERRLKLGGAPRPELAVLVADLCSG